MEGVVFFCENSVCKSLTSKCLCLSVCVGANIWACLHFHMFAYNKKHHAVNGDALWLVSLF